VPSLLALSETMMVQRSRNSTTTTSPTRKCLAYVLSLLVCLFVAHKNVQTPGPQPHYNPTHPTCNTNFLKSLAWQVPSLLCERVRNACNENYFPTTSERQTTSDPISNQSWFSTPTPFSRTWWFSAPFRRSVQVKTSRERRRFRLRERNKIIQKCA